MARETHKQAHPAVRVPPDVLAAMRTVALKESRTVSAQVTVALRDWLTQHGVTLAEPVTAPTPQVISRKDASAANMQRFYTGKSCINGHVAERYVSSGVCVPCHSASVKRIRDRQHQRDRDQRRT